MTYTFLELIGYVLVQLWNILIATFGGILALITIVIQFIGNILSIVVNLGGFIPWLIPNCLLPLYYCAVTIMFVKWIISITHIGSVFK